MTIIGIGVDLVNIRRIKDLTERWHDRFLGKVYTAAEQRLLLTRADPSASLAGRFAAKEAILKALGCGWSQGISWLDIEVLNDATGKPVVTVSGRAGDVMRQAGVTQILVSLSHDTEYAVAQAILTSDPTPLH